MPRVERPASNAEIAATLAILVAIAGVFGGRALVRRLVAHPSAEECAALLDRYVELVARQASPEPAASMIAARRATARAAVEQQGFTRCQVELTRAEVTCAMAAGNADELERCLP